MIPPSTLISNKISALETEKLYVHINTIRKRIDKVNELLQIDWSDNIARMNAELLLRFLNLEEKI